MNHHSGPTVQPRADAFYRLHDDVMPIPEAFVPTGRYRLTCSECLCIEKGSLSAASGAGLPTYIPRIRIGLFSDFSFSQPIVLPSNCDILTSPPIVVFGSFLA